MSKLFRVTVPAGDLEQSRAFYARVLNVTGEEISPDRYYFDCGGVILVCVRRRAEERDARPNANPIDFAVDDLDDTFERARAAGCSWLEEKIETRPWGERSFAAGDPFGNPLYFVDADTCFTGFHRPPAGEVA